MSVWEEENNKFNYVHDTIKYLSEQRTRGYMSIPDYLRATINLLDKTYGKNSTQKEIKQGWGRK